MMVPPVLFILSGLQAVRLPKAAAFADQVHEVMIIPDVPRRIIAPADAVNRHWKRAMTQSRCHRHGEDQPWRSEPGQLDIYVQGGSLQLDHATATAADWMSPSEIFAKRHHRARLGLLQDADNLLFPKLLPLHLSVPSFRSDCRSNWKKKRGSHHVQPPILIQQPIAADWFPESHSMAA